MKPTEQNTELRTHDPDFAAKVLMPPEVVWDRVSPIGFEAKVFDYTLKAFFPKGIERDNYWTIERGGELILTEETMHDPCIRAEIAFLRHYMKSLI
jgi:hypothetical protein